MHYDGEERDFRQFSLRGGEIRRWQLANDKTATVIFLPLILAGGINRSSLALAYRASLGFALRRLSRYNPTPGTLK